MQNYIVSARKYRPSNFDSVVGQQALTTTLKNAIAQHKLAHAYLFCGPRGVGKTTCARIFAKSINCLNPLPTGEACNECESCKAFNEQRSYNIHELDAASNNSVDDIRELIDQVQIPPQIGRYKVFIIDEVHMLSPQAFNAFLKTLEEPPAHAVFILATTERHKILPTILSRCQIYDFARMTVSDTVRHLEYVAGQEGITYEKEALHIIAEKADGAMRDALSIFDQVASYCAGNITRDKVIEDLNVLDSDEYFTMTDLLLQTNLSAVMLRLNHILSRGFEANYFIGGLASHFRNLLIGHDEQTLPLLEVSDRVRERYCEQAKRCTPRFLYRAIKICNTCDLNYRAARNKRLLVELALIEVGQLAAGDEEAGCGRRPTRQLKPIFQVAQPSVAAQPSQMQAQVSVSSAVSSVQSHPIQATESSQPTASANSTGTPTLVQQLQQSQVRSQQRSVHTARTLSIRSLQAQSMVQHPVQLQTSVHASNSANNASNRVLSNDFPQDRLEYNWFRYCNQMPKEKSAIAGRMRAMKPLKGPDFVVEVLVENEMVEHYMQDEKVSLTNYLRQNLMNDRIVVLFKVDENNVPKHAYSRVEQLNEMLESCESLAFLKEQLQLELA